MRRFLLFTLFIIYGSFLVSYADVSSLKCSEDGVTRIKNSILLCGVITSSMADEFIEEVSNDQPDQVIVNSPGGSGIFAVKILGAILDNKIDVIVTGKCISACAHIILTLAPNVEVLPDTLIAFHHTNTGNLRLYELNNLITDEFNFSFAMFSAKREKEIYLKSGVDALWLSEPTIRKGAGCFLEFLTEGNSSIVIGHRAKTNYSFWTPTREFFNFVRNTPVRGWWPEDQMELRKLASIKSSIRPIRFIMQNKNEPHLFVSKSYYSLPNCNDK